MNKILESLGIKDLDGSKQRELVESFEVLVEGRAKELAEKIVEERLSEEEETLKEKYEGLFEEYKSTITSEFSNFVDSVIEEELHIPEKVMEYARLGELYHDIVEQFKMRMAIDEGILDNEVKEILEEAKEEITSLKEDVNSLTRDNLTLKKDAQEMAASLYIEEKCEGLTPKQKRYVKRVLDGEIVKEDIDRKFDILVDSVNEKEETEDLPEMECKECGAVVTVKEGDRTDCPECGAKNSLKAVDEDGKGKKEVDESTEPLNESTPWNSLVEQWKGTIRG
jgi:DNA-directed RNA polymerase subunit RPC12/RpoP